jgi:hypothetical protein
MQLRDRLLLPFNRARKFTESLLDGFQTPADWTHQVYPGANHPLWIMGHLTTVDHAVFAKLQPGQAGPPEGYQARFGKGSTPAPAADAYPPPAELRAIMSAGRQRLVDLLTGMSNAQLASKLPGDSPLFTDFGSVFEFLTWHEGIHAGQLSVTHRALGHKPIVG